MPGPSETDVTREITNFLLDRRARGLSPATLEWYERELGQFFAILADFGAKNMAQFSPQLLRRAFEQLRGTRNPGGILSIYRAVRAFFNWYKEEIDPVPWVNPIKKVHVKTPNRDPLPGIGMLDVQKLLQTCTKDYYGKRDRAIILTLTDTGARRSELLALNIDDIDLKTGQVYIQHGKGDKPRIVFIGSQTIRAVIRYLRVRLPTEDPTQPLWVSRYGRRLGIKGLEQMIRTRSIKANIKVPGIHDFRRTFALESLRNGIDVYSLMRLMGHTSPQVLGQYLALVNEDLKKAHQVSSPIDNFSKKRRK